VIRKINNMQVSIDLNIEELLLLIRKLPEDHLIKIQGEISSVLQNKIPVNKDEYLKTLLEAPTMNDEQYHVFKENRNRFNQWKTS
jgi:hypothetical protein